MRQAMIRSGFLTSGRLAVPTSAKAGASFLTWRKLMLIAGAGVASAAIGQVLGRPLHLAWPIPASGSIITALPRTVILLAVLLGVKRFGALTAAGVAEVGAKLAFGGAVMWPMALIAPLLGNLAGDLLWYSLRRLPARRIRLMLTGAALCAARVLVALFFWSLLIPALSRAPENLRSLLVCIVAINIALGAIAGFLVGRSNRAPKPAVVNDERN